MNSFMFGFVFTLILLSNMVCGVYMYSIDNLVLLFFNITVAVVMVVTLFYKGYGNGK